MPGTAVGAGDVQGTKQTKSLPPRNYILKQGGRARGAGGAGWEANQYILYLVALSAVRIKPKQSEAWG